MHARVIRREDYFAIDTALRAAGLGALKLARAGTVWCDVWLSPDQKDHLRSNGWTFA